MSHGTEKLIQCLVRRYKFSQLSDEVVTINPLERKPTLTLVYMFTMILLACLKTHAFYSLIENDAREGRVCKHGLQFNWIRIQSVHKK